jgi:hypothetical protein
MDSPHASGADPAPAATDADRLDALERRVAGVESDVAAVRAGTASLVADLAAAFRDKATDEHDAARRLESLADGLELRWVQIIRGRA